MQITVKKHIKIWPFLKAGNRILATGYFPVCSHTVMSADMGLRGESI